MAVTAGYKETEVGVIPEDWHVRSLGELGDAIIGLTYEPSNVQEHGTLVLRSSNIQDDALAFDDNVFVNVDIPERLKIKSGDVLVCVRNGSRNLIGKTALLDDRALGMTFGAFMAVYRSPIGKLASYLFQSEILKRQINEHLGATINQITNKSLKSFRVPVAPDHAERAAIATALSDVDALLAGLDQLIAKKRDIKQATIQQLLTGQTRLPGFDGEWEVKRLGEVAVLNRVSVVPAMQPTQIFMHFSLPAFDDGRQAPLELGSSILSNKFGVPATAVLVSKLNPRIPRVWAPAFIPENAVASTEWLVLTPRGSMDREYLCAVCSSPTFCEQLELSATGTTGSHQRINPRTALDIEVLLAPGREEQGAIAALLSDMDLELSALEARRDKTRLLKEGMMQELLTGKTRLVIPAHGTANSC